MRSIRVARDKQRGKELHEDEVSKPRAGHLGTSATSAGEPAHERKSK